MSKSILIIGGGVIGLCTAYYCLQSGRQVTLLERGEPDHDGCSLGNAGFVVPSHFTPLAAPGAVSAGLRMMFNPESPFAIRPRLSLDLLKWVWHFCRSANAGHVARSAPILRDLNLASRACFEELAALPGADFGLVKNGLLMLCKSDKALEEEARLAAAARRLGLFAEALTPDETARLDPGVRREIAGAVYFPQDCHLHPQRFMSWLTQTVQDAGGRIEWSTRLLGWRAEGGVIQSAQTNRGDYEADEYVLTAGSWTPGVVRGLGLNLLIQAGKGYSLTLPHPPRRPIVASLLTEARVAVTPMGEAVRFGGTMEITGLDRSINQRRVAGIVKSIPKYLPDFQPEQFEKVPVWRGLRPCSPDGIPYIGRVRSYSNLCIGSGHAMMGLSLGPITGKLIAQILSNVPPSIDISALHPDRFD